jgi:uncharacterized membrane protein
MSIEGATVSANAVLGISIGAAVASIIAFVLFFITMHRLSKHYKEPAIFRNILYSLILNIIMCIVIGVMIAAFIPLVGTQFVLDSITDATIMQTALLAIMLFIAATCIAIFTVIISGVLHWRAFTKLGEKSGVDSFKTAGLLFMLGSILQIIGIGAILCWISWIYAAKGFKQIQPINNSVNYTANNSNKIYCSHCGIENNTDNNTNYCSHCGKTLYTNQTNT